MYVCIISKVTFRVCQCHHVSTGLDYKVDRIILAEFENVFKFFFRKTYISTGFVNFFMNVSIKKDCFHNLILLGFSTERSIFSSLEYLNFYESVLVCQIGLNLGWWVRISVLRTQIGGGIYLIRMSFRLILLK